jgi:uncharacterized protein with WD repeat
VLIKSDKVEFVGSEKMTPILSLNEPKVDEVIFSPCERYLMVYSPERNEDATTFKWSFDGNFIAKIIKKAGKNEGEEEKDGEEVEQEKAFIGVYELPSMKMILDGDGNRTSVAVDGLRDFKWAPNANMIVHTSFPTAENAFPRITFLEIPSRKNVHVHTHKDSKNFKLFFHPDGSFLAVMNEFTLKKQTQFSVEIFHTTDIATSNLIPH